MNEILLFQQCDCCKEPVKSKSKVIPNHHPCECGCGKLVASNRRFVVGHSKRGKPGKGKKGPRSRKPKPELQLCECGCGAYAKPGKKYIYGHNRKGKGKPKSPPQLCWCHCGGMTKPGRRYIYGHKSKGFLHTEVKQKMRHPKSEDTKQKMRKPKSEMHKQNMKLAQNKPERKLLGSKPEVRAKQKASLKITMNKPEVKEANSKKTTESWQDSEYVRKQMKARKVKQNKLECRGEIFFDSLFPSQKEYGFVGQGKVIIGGKCPDFININGQKKIIEIYGDYFHRNDDPQIRINFFAKFGYDTLVIWEHEFKDLEALAKRVLAFHNKVNPYSVHKLV